MKRLFDLILGLCAAAVMALPILLVAILVRLTSAGPALYWSDRGNWGQVLQYNTLKNVLLQDLTPTARDPNRA